MIMVKELEGICVALCTPFSDDGEKVDETALKNHIDSMLEAGLRIILVCGGTGEFAYLRPSERKEIAKIASKHIDGRAKFVVQTSAINTLDAIDFSRHAEDVGADCLLILPPFFEGPDSEGVYYHYEKIAEAIDTPIMVYNIPIHSGFDVTPTFFKRLMKIDNIQYIKDSTADITRIQELLAVGARVFNGADPIAFYSLLAGCPGCVWGAPNAMPKQSVDLYNAVASGNLNEARDMWTRMFPANYFFWTHVYNASVKAATELSGRKVGPCRRPVQPLTDVEMSKLKKALKPLSN
jgi:4-hydroxy-tetrahydrodipicolinate synthase